MTKLKRHILKNYIQYYKLFYVKEIYMCNRAEECLKFGVSTVCKGCSPVYFKSTCVKIDGVVTSIRIPFNNKIRSYIFSIEQD